MSRLATIANALSETIVDLRWIYLPLTVAVFARGLPYIIGEFANG